MIEDLRHPARPAKLDWNMPRVPEKSVSAAKIFIPRRARALLLAGARMTGGGVETAAKPRAWLTSFRSPIRQKCEPRR